jgi:Zn-dependent protease/predicted transcriptional regulator
MPSRREQEEKHMAFGGNLKLGRIAGIDIGIHWSWLVIFILLTWWLAAGLYDELYPEWSEGERWGTAVASSLLFFAAVLAHEMAHSLVAIRRGIPVRSINLFIFGGVADIAEEPKNPRDEFAIAVVGPLTSLGLAGVFALIGLGLGFEDTPPAAMVGYLATVNALVGVFNLLPGLPLDGGRLLRAGLWARLADFVKATRWAALAGSGVAFLLMGLGVVSILAGNFLGGIWLIVIGWFLRSAAEASYRQVVMGEALEGVQVASLVRRDVRPVPPDISISDLVQDYLMARAQRALPVMKADELLGVVTLSDLQKAEKDKWDQTRVADIMTPREDLLGISTADAVSEAIKLMTARDIHQLPVMEGGRFVGFVTRGDVLRVMSMRVELRQTSR